MNGHDYLADFQRLNSAIKDHEREAVFLQAWNDPRESPLARFCYAVGLVAYGHLKFVEQVLDLLPVPGPGEPRIRAAVLVRVVKDLLPLSARLDPENVNDHVAIKEWVQANAHQLAWNEERGLFEFR